MTVTPVPTDELAPRTRLEPTSSRHTILDGGWWPRSTDLAVELPALVASLLGRRGAVTHALLNAADWDLPHPRRLAAAGGAVRLGWFTAQPAGLITLICEFGKERIDLLVVPPATGSGAAETAMAAAADADNRRRTPALLADLPQA